MNQDDKTRTDTLARTRVTWLLYIITGCFGYLLNGLGAVLQPLRHQLGVSQGWVGVYPTFFAMGLISVGFVGGALVKAVGREPVLRGALALLVMGAVAICIPQREVSLIGAAVSGAGGALVVQLVPATLAAAHPAAAPIAIGEANALSSLTSVLGPLAVAAGLVSGLGWQLGYLLPVPILVAVLVLLGKPRHTAAPASDMTAISRPGDFASRWLDVLLAVSVEFCLVFWSATALHSWAHLDQTESTAASAAFLVGMAIGRGSAGPIVRWLRTERRVLTGSCAVALVGFGLFWSTGGPALNVVGLLATGLGTAMLYPVTITRAMAACPEAPDRAAARCALASGIAIGGAPLLLAQLAEHLDLRIAYLLAPLLLTLILLRTVGTRHRVRPRGSVYGRSRVAGSSGAHGAIDAVERERE